jgi:hypothetical protein
LDIPKYLQSGSIQHLGENVLAITNHLVKNTTLTGIEKTNQVVYFDVYGKVSWSLNDGTVMDLSILNPLQESSS